MAQGNHRPGNGHIILIMGQSADKALVEFELVHRHALEPCQGAVTGAEVVDGQAQAQLAQAAKQGQGRVGVVHHRAFGHLQLQQGRVEAGFGQYPRHPQIQLAAAEQAAGHVHRDKTQRRACRLPGHHLPAGVLQYPGIDGADQAAFLGNRDKFPRRHQAALGVLPAHEGFGADHALVFQADQRLVVDPQLVVLQGMAQGADQLDPLACVLGQLLGVEGVALAAAALGLEQRRIDIAQHLGHVLAVAVEQTDADAGADKQLLTHDFEGLLEAVQYQLGHAGGAFGIVAVLAEQAEFVAP